MIPFCENPLCKFHRAEKAFFLRIQIPTKTPINPSTLSSISQRSPETRDITRHLFQGRDNLHRFAERRYLCSDCIDQIFTTGFRREE
jgi:hypothetical protein